MLSMLRKLVFNLEDIKISGSMHVKTLQEQFKSSFGTEIRVYKSLNTGRGSKRAEPKATLASLSDRKIINEMEIRKNNSVGEVEQQFKDELGIGIQIMMPDGKTFADNAMKLKDVGK